MEWQPIQSAPVRTVILLGNAGQNWVAAGYGEYIGKIPAPIWHCLDDTGFGRCKPTHWKPLPEPPEAV